MDSCAIRADGLGKRYRIGPKSASYGRLTESLAQFPNLLLRRTRRIRSENDHIWALRDVSFEIPRGETLGVIGRNGAGKTTLLKILSRITDPTEGRVDLFGRVGSLLEVGTGFHPELSGRENIFLNGAILGMSRREISARFDEIVDFAEVEKFLDTPVKRYSSGMYVRLAFAVAAHLEPEILLVDEVLAVGDVAFQKKCLGKMDDVARTGRTVLFVSHNTTAILSLCNTALLIDKGTLVRHAAVAEVVDEYLDSVQPHDSHPLKERTDRAGDGKARLVSLSIESLGKARISSNSALQVKIEYESETEIRNPRFLIGAYDYSNTGIFLLDSEAAGGLPEVLPPRGTVTCTTDAIRLTAGRCYLNAALLRGQATSDHIHHAAIFDVEAEDVYGTGKVPGREWVLYLLPQSWTPSD